MSLFDPYSHTRIHELRQEQLARKARRHNELGLEAALHADARKSTSALIATLTSRWRRGEKPAAPVSAPATAPNGRPALDS